MAGCASKAANNDTFDLSAAVPDAGGPSSRSRQLLVATPSALKAINSDQIVIRVSDSEIQYLAKSQWSDQLPLMVQSRLVEVFENTGRLGGVGKPGQGLAIDFQLVTDIRAFEIDAKGGSRAVVEISAKILNDRNGTVKAQKVFSASVPVASSSRNRILVRALDTAFSKVSTEIVDWALTKI